MIFFSGVTISRRLFPLSAIKRSPGRGPLKTVLRLDDVEFADPLPEPILPEPLRPELPPDLLPEVPFPELLFTFPDEDVVWFVVLLDVVAEEGDAAV